MCVTQMIMTWRHAAGLEPDERRKRRDKEEGMEESQPKVGATILLAISFMESQDVRIPPASS